VASPASPPGSLARGGSSGAAEARAAGVSVFSGHSAAITCCRFSPDGASVASASSDGTVRIWGAPADGSGGGDGGGGRRAATLYCGSALGALAWEHRASRLLLLATGSGAVRAWDTEAQRIVCQSAPPAAGTHPQPAAALAASPCGTAFALATAGGAALWSLRGFAPSAPLAGAAGDSRALSLAYNHNGRLLAAACADGWLRLYDTAAAGGRITASPPAAGGGGSGGGGGGSSGPIMSWLAGPPGDCAALQFGADGNSLLALAADGALSEWSLLLSERPPLRRCSALALQPPAEPPAPPRRYELALHAGGRAALACGGGAAAASLIVLRPGGSDFGPVLPLEAGHAAAATSVDWHPTRLAALSGSADATVRSVSTAAVAAAAAGSLDE
jgi:WD40 repeat protein